MTTFLKMKQLLRPVRQRVRRWKLRRDGISGSLPNIVQAYPTLHIQGTAEFGRNCTIWSSKRDETVIYVIGHLVVGENVFINQGTVICVESGQRITIESHAKIGNNVRIITSNFHASSPDEPVKAAPVELKWNCWLGIGVMVMPGVTIGRHSVVAAGSVVTRDVPDRTVVAGVPAKAIREIQCSEDWVRT